MLPISTGTDAALVSTRRACGGNCAISNDPSPSADQAESGARRAAAANGLADVATAAARSRISPARGDADRLTRAHRAIVREALVVPIFLTFAVLVRRTLARARRWWRFVAVDDALRALDDRTLRDLGFHRSEIASVAAELTALSGRARHCRPGRNAPGCDALGPSLADQAVHRPSARPRPELRPELL
jgi:uncharacterized protein YjiS (DUF1127 family)